LLCLIELIVNPLAGAGKCGRQWPHILQCLESNDIRFDYEMTAYKGHTVDIARDAAGKGCSMVVAVGGDGTIHEVVNGLFKANSLDKTLVGIIDTGTGGDYIRTIGIPHDINEACRRLKNPGRMIVDLGTAAYMGAGGMSDRIFINFAGIGFAAEIVRSTTQTFKKMGTKPAYLMGLFSNLLFYTNHRVSLTIDGENSDIKVCTLLVNIGKYCGGAMKTAPDADPSDGRFDVITVGDLSKPDLLWSLPSIYNGTHLKHPKVSVQLAREISIATIKKASLQADGELLGEAPCSFNIMPVL
jgi:YegS/Rv2252/BmrU family lipid kinase